MWLRHWRGLFLLMHLKHECMCVCFVHILHESVWGVFPVRMVSSNVTNITRVCTLGNIHTSVLTDTHLHTLCSLLMPIYQTVDNESQHLCFQPVFVSSAFILMELSDCEGNMLLDRASFTLWFCFAVSEADRLCWTQGELVHSTDHAL